MFCNLLAVSEKNGLSLAVYTFQLKNNRNYLNICVDIKIPVALATKTIANTVKPIFFYPALTTPVVFVQNSLLTVILLLPVCLIDCHAFFAVQLGLCAFIN